MPKCALQVRDVTTVNLCNDIYYYTHKVDLECLVTTIYDGDQEKCKKNLYLLNIKY